MPAVVAVDVFREGVCMWSGGGSIINAWRMRTRGNYSTQFVCLLSMTTRCLKGFYYKLNVSAGFKLIGNTQ